VHAAGGQRVAELIDAGGVFLGEDADIADDVRGRGEAVAVDGWSDEHGSGRHATARDGHDLQVRRSGPCGSGIAEQAAQLLRGVWGVAYLDDEIVSERFSHVAVQAGDRLRGEQVQWLGQFRGEVRNLLQRGPASLADALGGGILVEPVQYPGAAPIVGEVGEFGK